MNNSGKISATSSLRPAAYQLVPLLKILENGLDAVLISDGVGVGKTISAGYIISYLSSALNRPPLVVCPPSLVDKWVLELQSKFGTRTFPIRSPEELPAAVSETRHTGEARVSHSYVMSNSLLRERESSHLTDLALVVFDEIHNYRNRSTRWHEGAVELAEKARFRAGLTATPINNSLEDLSSELRILMPRFDWDCMKIVTEDLWRTGKEIISLPVITRFVKEKLGIHFAKRDIVHVQVSYPTGYYSWVRDVVDAARGTQTSHDFSFDTITLYRLAASSPRAFSEATGQTPPEDMQDEKLAIFRRIVESSQSAHILAFCEFRETVKLLQENVDSRPVYTMTGETPMFDRVSTLDEFRRDRNALLVMTAVGSEGLDMQFADTIVNYDLHWNPMKLEQRIGRIDRIGQQKDVIRVINFVVDGSIDHRVLAVLSSKLNIVARSVFEPSPILGAPQGNKLFDKETLESELSSGQRLVSALEWTNQIPQKDYGILASVDTSLCDVKKLRQLGQQGIKGSALLRASKQAERYLQELRSQSSALLKLLEYYA